MREFSFELNSEGTIDLKMPSGFKRPKEVERKTVFIREITYEEATNMYEDLKFLLER